MTSSSSGYQVGVMGTAGTSTKVNSFGLAGLLNGQCYGAGVYGSTTAQVPTTLWTTKYAGYFQGPTCVSGTLTAKSVVTPSDKRLKENIVYLCDDEKDQNALDQLLKVNIVRYNLKSKESGYVDMGAVLSGQEATAVMQTDNADGKTYFGVIAQEIQEVIPEVVEESEDGYLAVNYTELVPLLIRSVQILKEEVETLRELCGLSKSSSLLKDGTQSSPIRCELSESDIILDIDDAFTATDAEVRFYDIQGKQVMRTFVGNARNRIVLNRQSLPSGTYVCTIYAGGMARGSKKIVL